MEQLTCQRCQHSWYPRTPSPPGVCPRCKSPRWDTPRIASALKCQRCLADWRPRIIAPKRCPACKTPYWDRPRGVVSSSDSLSDQVPGSNHGQARSIPVKRTVVDPVTGNRHVTEHDWGA